MNSIKFSAAVCSDKGRIRNNNEDNFYFNGTHLTSENRDEHNFLRIIRAAAKLCTVCLTEWAEKHLEKKRRLLQHKP